MNKQIILTYDYELFFGDKSGTVRKSLIEPTNRLMDCMERCGFRGVFFVDWQMLKYLKDEGVERTMSDYEMIKVQLQDMVRRGHRIELHIHPHWVDAKYNGDGTWDFSDFKHYSLNSFSEEEIVSLFEEGYKLLTSIARDIDPTYKIIAFRAGGWAVQPFNALKKAFLNTGIKIDSSVMRGAFDEREGSYYDFRKAPKVKIGYYRFEEDVCIEDNNGSFLEVPISNIKLGIFYRLLSRVHSMYGEKIKCLTDGTHSRKTSKGSQVKKHNRVPFTLSNVNPWNVIYAHLLCGAEVSCYIDHPKDFTNNTEQAIMALSKINCSTITYNDLINK